MKQLKIFKYDKDNALTFSKEDREKVQDKFGVYVIFDKRRLSSLVKQGLFWLPTYYKDLFNKLGQYNLKSGVGTTKFKKV